MTSARKALCSVRSLPVWRQQRLIATLGGTALDKPGDIDEFLSRPTWSVAGLLPTEANSDRSPAISASQLNHLLRLSALPPPKDQVQEDKMLKTLTSQLHFVKAIQDVDTTAVQPLASLRDETAAGKTESELGLHALRDALASEETIGQYHKRIRRKRSAGSPAHFEQWDVLGNAEKKVGRFFVVESGKD